MTTRLLAILCFVFTFTSSYAQWTPPPPVDNAFFKSMVGKWTGQSDMGGMKMNEELNCYMQHNGQFLVMEVAAKSLDGQTTFEGHAMYGINEQGNPMVWWFDTWGASAVMTGTGAFAGNNMVSITSTNSTMTDDRTIIIKGDEMTIDWKGTYKDDKGTTHNMSLKTSYTRVK